jgi:hypothetical protein
MAPASASGRNLEPARTLSRTSIRLSGFTTLALLASAATPTLAHAQSSQGSIAVAATILPAALMPAADVTIREGAAGSALLTIGSMASTTALPNTFVRLTRGESAGPDGVFVAHPAGPAATMRLEPSSAEIRLRLERLVTAGT